MAEQGEADLCNLAFRFWSNVVIFNTTLCTDARIVESNVYCTQLVKPKDGGNDKERENLAESCRRCVLLREMGKEGSVEYWMKRIQGERIKEDDIPLHLKKNS